MSKARVRFGPLGVNPTIELTNFGVDTNVFNDPAGQAKRDVTFTVAPRADLWLRIGPTWITGNVREDVVWYQKYSSERSLNNLYTLGWLVPLNRLTFAVSTTYLNTRERPGFEIDARSRRRELTFKGAAEIRALAKSFFGVRGSRQTVDYAADAVFLGSNLHSELNRVVTSGTVTLRNQLTPLTSITLDVGRQEDRFTFSSLRDSNSTTAGVQVSFDPQALIRGSARVGFRDFKPLAPGVPSYQGATAAVDLTYTILGMTRLGAVVGRDVQYSYDVNQPYYVQTGVTGSIAQQVYGPLDVVGRAGIQRLAYRDRGGVAVLLSDRTDTAQTYGGGAGYHLGTDLRIGVNVDKQRRLSNVSQRRFDALRFGVSVTYGF